MAGRTRGGKLERDAALAGRPRQLPFLRRHRLDSGGIEVTVLLRRGGWTRWLGWPGEFERTFRLDRLGCEVYDACDGQTDVRSIIRGFAEAHRISIAEAELSVSTFLRTLMSKGLVAILLDREES